MENGIINLIGFTCTCGVLFVWAKDTFGRNANELDEEKEFLIGEEIEEVYEEAEQPWKKYVRHQEPGPGKHKIII